jgi:hypothetical protein
VIAKERVKQIHSSVIMSGQGENTVILRVQLSEEDTEKKLRKLVLDIEATRKAQAQLQKERRLNIVTDEEYKKRTVDLALQLKSQRGEFAANQKNLEQFRQATTSATGSVDQLKAQSALLTTQYNALSVAERTTTAAGLELGEQLESVNNQLKAAGAKVGDFRRNVGDYPKLFGQIGASAGAAVGRLEELDNTTGAFGGTVGELKNKFNQAKAGIEAAKVGFTGLKDAIAATGIGVFLLALGVLFTYLTRTQSGLDFVERKTKGLSIVVGVLTDKVSEVGEYLFKAFDNPKQALSDLVDFIGNNLMNRLNSVFVVLDGIANFDGKKIADGFIQAGTGITDATAKGQNLVAELGEAQKAGEAIAAENQRIRDTERAINVERAQSKKDIEALKLIAEDVTKSTTERAAATQKAAELEQRSINGQLQAQRARIANLEKEARITNQLTENNDELAEQRIKLAELEEGSLTRQIELNNKLNELRQAGLEKSLADQKAYYERLAVQAEKGSTAELNAKIKALESDRVAQLAAVGLTENQRRLIIANSEQAIKQLRREFALTTYTQQAALDQQALDRKLTQVQAGSEEELELLRRKLEVQRDVELQAANLTISQRTAITNKFFADSQKLEIDAIKARAVAAYEQELSSVQAELTLVKKGTDEETELRREAIDTQLRKELAALDKRKDNAAQEALLRANSAKALNDVNYSAALAKLENFLADQKQALDDAQSKGLLSERAYTKAVLVNDSIAAGTRLQLAKDFHQETTELARRAKDTQIAIQQQLTSEERASIEERKQLASSFGQAVGSLIADSLLERGANIEQFLGKILILALDTIESN